MVTSPAHLIVLSAQTPQALEEMTDRLAEHLANHPEISLPDVAYTCQTGQKAFFERRCLVSRSKEDAITSLRERPSKSVYSGRAQHGRRPVAFLFPGLGNQYINMGLGLYREVPVFRQAMDSCAEILRPLISVNIIETLYPKGTHAAPEPTTSGRLDLSRLVRGGHAGNPPDSPLNQTYVAQPTLFAIEYALSRLLLDWGVKPHCVVGHSLGEYVAACVAGVYSMEDALTLVALRAKLIQSKVPEGGMLAAAISEAETQALLPPGLSIAAVNGEALTVVGGPKPLINDLEIELRSRGIAGRVLAATHAFHSKMLEPIAQEFTSMAAKFRRNEPQIAILSNVTGKVIQGQEMNAPEYWARHMVQTVKFADCARELMRESDHVLLEIGPGQDLCIWTMQLCRERAVAAFGSLRHEFDLKADFDFLLGTVGRMWIQGVPIDWESLYSGQCPRRCSLPSYPFERQQYSVEAGRT